MNIAGNPKVAAIVCALAGTEEGRRTLDAMEDERQENCIHCGARWYAIHHKDGVCHICQSDGKPGRSTIKRRQERFDTTLEVGSILLGIVLAGLMYWYAFR